MIYLELFISFLYVGLFSIGGGYAALPLIENQVVDRHHWLSAAEFVDLITISQMTPGPIAINSATFVGIRIAGIWGAVIATMGCILPSCVIVSILAYVYLHFKGASVIESVLGTLRPAVVSLIASAGLSILIVAFWGEQNGTFKFSQLDVFAVVIFGICMLLLKKFKMNPVGVMIVAGGLGIVYCFL